MESTQVGAALIQPLGGRYFTALAGVSLSLDAEIWSTKDVWTIACDFHKPQDQYNACGVILLLPRPEVNGVQQAAQESLAATLAALGWQLHPWAGIGPPDITARCPLHTCQRCRKANSALAPGEIRFGADVRCWGEVPDESVPGGYRLLREGE